MSYDDYDERRIWVGDLDDYIYLDFTDYETEEVCEEPDDIGDVVLFSGKRISLSRLIDRGITPEKWRWMLHDAEGALGSAATWMLIETAFLKAIIASGRRYGVARYARLEKLPYSSAITATLPYGIRALLYQYMTTEPSLSGSAQRKKIQEVFQCAVAERHALAYDRTSMVRQGLHELAQAVAGPQGHLSLDPGGMRDILSLCRLYFLNLEYNPRYFNDLNELNQKYKLARITAADDQRQGQVVTGRHISKWRVRHLHPLPFFFPYSIRNALMRANRHATETGCQPDRSIAVNELALVNCEIELMRQTAIERNKTSDAIYE